MSIEGRKVITQVVLNSGTVGKFARNVSRSEYCTENHIKAIDECGNILIYRKRENAKKQKGPLIILDDTELPAQNESFMKEALHHAYDVCKRVRKTEVLPKLAVEYFLGLDLQRVDVYHTYDRLVDYDGLVDHDVEQYMSPFDLDYIAKVYRQHDQLVELFVQPVIKCSNEQAIS